MNILRDFFRSEKSWSFRSFFDVQPDEVLSIVRSSNYGALAGIVNAVLISICIWPNGSAILMGLWLASSVLLFGYIAYRSHLAKNYKPEYVSVKAVWRTVWLSLLYGVPWILLAIMTLATNELDNILLVLMLCTGMSAGSGLVLYRVPLAAFACAGSILFAIIVTVIIRDVKDLWPMIIYSLTYSMILANVILTSWRIARDRENSLVEISKANEEIRCLAETDTLTGLYNRKLFTELLEKWVTESQGKHIAVIVMDLDRFKNINDTIGHGAGDQLLSIVAKRLSTSVSENDIVARFGGDEFAIAIDLDSSKNTIAVTAQKILDSLNEPVTIARAHIHPNASLGIALCPDHSTSSNDLIHHADVALLKAKENGRGQYIFYDAEMSISIARMDEIEVTLKDALERKKLQLFYQPKFVLDTGEFAGAEAVLRWIENDKAPASTYHMIEVAENRGMIPSLSEYIYDRFIEDLEVLRSHGDINVPISLNLHPLDLKTPEILTSRLKSIDKAGLPLRNIMLEISESAFVGRGSDDVSMVIDTLHELGVRFALDDFGLGKASLSHINGLPLSEIKIDRQFTSGLSNDPHKKAIVSATFELVRSLGIGCTVMGITSEEQVDHLKKLNTLGKSLLVQGRFWSKATVVDDLAGYRLQLQAKNN